MNNLIGILIGFLFAIIIGHFATKIVVDFLWESIGWNPSNYEERPEYYLPRLEGIIERTLYVASLQIGKPEFIGVWLALKVAGQWKRWGKIGKISGRNIEGRVFYNIFLIGSGLSIFYAAVGQKIIVFFNMSQWLYFITLPLSLILGTIIFYYLAKYWVNKCKREITNNKIIKNEE